MIKPNRCLMLFVPRLSMLRLILSCLLLLLLLITIILHHRPSHRHRRLPNLLNLTKHPQHPRTHIQTRTKHERQIAQRHLRSSTSLRPRCPLRRLIDQIDHSPQQVPILPWQTNDKRGKVTDERCRGRTDAGEVGEAEGGEGRGFAHGGETPAVVVVVVVALESRAGAGR